MFVGMYAIVKEISVDNYGGKIEDARKSSVGRICRVREPHEGTSQDGITINTGEVLVEYARITEMGVDYINFYAKPSHLQKVEATEDMLILYSHDLWQLISPYGEKQNSKTFKRLSKTFGLVEA
ncbi:MAG: hypothetical protein ACT6RL_19840 [Neoaquamicrobium sediminum]|uniref:hypothetical protein n=1 Tax=Neoaquamicrobium sediminum TaxID=1849104 RepID=UPI0040372FB7